MSFYRERNILLIAELFLDISLYGYSRDELSMKHITYISHINNFHPILKKI